MSDHSGDYAQDIAELMKNGATGDPGSQGAINELYARAQSDPRILSLMKDAVARLNDGRHQNMKPADGPIWPRIGELRGEKPPPTGKPTEKEVVLMGIIKSLLEKMGGGPDEVAGRNDEGIGRPQQEVPTGLAGDPG